MLRFMDDLLSLEVPDMEKLSEGIDSTTLAYPVIWSVDALVEATLEWDPADTDNDFVKIAMFPPTSIMSMGQPQPIQPQPRHLFQSQAVVDSSVHSICRDAASSVVERWREDHYRQINRISHATRAWLSSVVVGGSICQDSRGWRAY